MNAFYIGQNMGLGTASGCKIAEAVIYDVALTAGDVLQLSKRFGPPRVKTANIIHYWPLYGRGSNEIDIVGGKDLTPSGTTASDHPGVFK
jgi:hypothetical protein